MGGVQTVMYVPQPDGKFGYYRSGSDFRKDGEGGVVAAGFSKTKGRAPRVTVCHIGARREMDPL